MTEYTLQINWYDTVTPDDKSCDDIIVVTGSENDAIDIANTLLNNDYDNIFYIAIYLNDKLIATVQ